MLSADLHSKQFTDKDEVSHDPRLNINRFIHTICSKFSNILIRNSKFFRRHGDY